MQHEIVHAIEEEVKRTVRQQVSEVVRREVTQVVQRAVMKIVTQTVTDIVQQHVTGIVQEQVTSVLEKQLSSIQQSNPNPSNADVARTPPSSRPNNPRTVSNQTTASTFTDTLYCTVDVSNVEEAERDNASASKIRQVIGKEMREGEGEAADGMWQSQGTLAMRIQHPCTCRDESELARVKEAAEKTEAAGTHVLRDQWHPVKADNTCHTAVLDEHCELRTDLVEMLEKVNEVSIAKLS